MDFSFNSCSNDISKMNDLQLFLLSEACPDDLKNSLLEKQLDLIEELNIKLALLNDSLTIPTIKPIK